MVGRVAAARLVLALLAVQASPLSVSRPQNAPPWPLQALPEPGHRSHPGRLRFMRPRAGSTAALGAWPSLPGFARAGCWMLWPQVTMDEDVCFLRYMNAVLLESAPSGRRNGRAPLGGPYAAYRELAQAFGLSRAAFGASRPTPPRFRRSAGPTMAIGVPKLAAQGGPWLRARSCYGPMIGRYPQPPFQLTDFLSCIARGLLVWQRLRSRRVAAVPDHNPTHSKPQHSTSHQSIPQHTAAGSTTQHDATAQHNATQRNGTQHNTTQHSMTQNNLRQRNTTHHSIAQ